MTNGRQITLIFQISPLIFETDLVIKVVITIQVGTGTPQHFRNHMTLVIFLWGISKCPKTAPLEKESFACNHSINAVLIRFNSTKQNKL